MVAASILDERTKDILALLGVAGPILLAAIATLIAAWQVVQGYSVRIDRLSKEFESVLADIRTAKMATERNKIYLRLINDLVVNLASIDSLQEGRLARLEESAGEKRFDVKKLAEVKARLGKEYIKVLEEIALLSGSEEQRAHAALSLGAGGGDMGTLMLLHELAALLPEHESDVHFKAVAMIRQRYLEEERRLARG